MRNYSVTMKYIVTMPDETEEVLIAEGLSENDLTELISEVQHWHTSIIDSHTGITVQDWVYLAAQPEMWTEGWYNIAKMPPTWEGATVENMRRLVLSKRPDRMVRVVISGIECKFDTWTWEGM